MRYSTGDAFRQALLDQLRNEVRRTGQDYQWLVRRIAFERLLARLIKIAPEQWILKGGLALDFRLAGRARTTQDVDLAWLTDVDAADRTLLTVRQQDDGDHFTLRVERTSILDTADVGGAVRYRVDCELAARRLVGFHLDIGFSRPLLTAPDELDGPTILTFSGIPRITVPVIPLSQHIAEKVHAYTRQYAGGRQSTRVKDLVDLVLIQANAPLVAGELRETLDSVFSSREIHPLPATLPPPPTNWPVPYRRMAASLNIPTDLNVGHQLAASFLDPVLTGLASDTQVWNPERRAWADAQGA